MAAWKPALAVWNTALGEVQGSNERHVEGLDLPRLPPASPCVPRAADMAAWRRIADLQLEKVLTGYDDLLVRGVSASNAAEQAILEFQTWVDRSLAALPTERAMTMLGARTVRDERARWRGLGQKSAVESAADPSALDRFLRLYLGMAHEAAARGFASLLTAP